MAETKIPFNAAASVELKSLSAKLSTNEVEVVKHALSLYALVVDELIKERSRYLGFFLVTNNGYEAEKIVVVPGLDRVVPGLDRPVRVT